MTSPPLVKAVDEAAEDTESVLAAYRERKRKVIEAARSSDAPAVASPVGSPTAVTPTPSSARAAPPPMSAPPSGSASTTATSVSTPSSWSPSTTPAPAWPPIDPSTDLAPARSPGSPPRPTPPVSSAPPVAPTSPVAAAPPQWLEGPPLPPPSASLPAASRGLQVHRPAPIASAPGATLSPLGPALRLSDALLKDTRVSLRGSPKLRAAGVVVLLLGLVLAALAARQDANDATIAGLDLVAVGLVLLGGLVAIVGVIFPRSRRLAVRLAASQKEEWGRIQHETRRLQVQSRLGLAGAILGLVLVTVGFSLPSTPVLGAGAVLAAVGVPLLVVAQVRRSLARRLYVQTLVLSGLEASGLGGAAPDDRVQPVILALDRLLGALPESEVQAFLATPQARAYLELVDEATRSGRER